MKLLSSMPASSIAAWEYLDLSARAPVTLSNDDDPAPESKVEAVGFNQEEVTAQIASALADARREWQKQTQEALDRKDLQLVAVISAFGKGRAEYFRQLEVEVVQLSLAVARKVLQREIAIDPTLLKGLVRVLLDRLGPETPVLLRVAPSARPLWFRALSGSALQELEVKIDDSLTSGDCILEAPSGSANIGVEAQLKEIEQSFEDLLARRPEIA